MLTKTATSGLSYSEEDVRAQVEKMVQDSAFFSSRILKRFLLFIVNETLGGRSNCLKEYTIAVNVLDKPVDFKPQDNGIVRIHAGRLRRAISHYYGKQGASDKIRISIPKGNYVPSFENVALPGHNAFSEENKMGTMAKLKPSRNVKVAVLPFRYNANEKVTGALADGIAFQLTAGLQSFNNISVVAFQMIKNLSEKTVDLRELTSSLGSQFVLTGGVESLNDRVRVSIELVKADSFEQIWSDLFDKNISSSNLFDLEDEISKLALAKLRVWFDYELGKDHKVALMPVSRVKSSSRSFVQ